MRTYLWLSKRSAKIAKVGQRVFFGYRGKLVLNPTSCTPEMPVGVIEKLPGDGSALVKVNPYHSIFASGI